MDKKKISYLADYKLNFISQLFLSNRRMHYFLLLYILCCNVINYRIWGIFYFSIGDLVHLLAIWASSCGCAVVYGATLSGLFCDLCNSYIFLRHSCCFFRVLLFGFRVLLFGLVLGFLPWQTWVVICECPCTWSCDICWKDKSLIGDLPLPKCVFIFNLYSCS